ncbi:dipeptidase E [Clostridium cavendishii DSM 21758]|uniref:Dipeptidase E n=1 Tax=Clostridium cavendishii DSM 21758 TaxID=1121302 RepID=A0A1M6F0V0_9CLOT|nr:Type 1 glutamine amidotransferase-like domain-containing protein [Clostridium cavendishii]SHI91364.1 dipeptidase E [Clostridium cavendishii DSM 21758]
MKIILFSEQRIDQKNPMNLDLAKIVNKKDAKLAYISPTKDEAKKYFDQTKNYYDSIGIKRLDYYNLYDNFDDSKVENILSCDAIHLSGEDTQELLKIINERNFKIVIDKFNETDKPIICVGAGSVIMTKSIESVKFIGGSYDDKLSDGLNMVDFEFIPNWGENKNNLFMVIDYSAKRQHPIYCCKDGYGIIVNNKEINFYGEITKIEKGRVSLLNGNVRLY